MDVYDFTVLAESREWIAVNKPAPLIVHPTSTKPEPTLWHGLRELLRYEIINNGQISLINRLDRETSGITLVAKSFRSARLLGKAMMQHLIQKEYIAIIHGWPNWENISCSKPLLRMGSVMESEIYVRQCVHPQGKPSKTTFFLLKKFENQHGKFALVRCQPHSGRMHQIRVHLSHLGHPILGDKIYGKNPLCFLKNMESGWTDELAQELIFPRQALHASLLKFPFFTIQHAIKAPLPYDMEIFLAE